MKRIVSILLCVLFCVLLLGGCSYSEVGSFTRVELPETRPDNFAIYYQWGYSSANFLDTYEGKIGKDLIAAGSASSDLQVSDQMLDDIYALIVTYDIASINKEMNSDNLAGLFESRYAVAPCAYYTIRFRVNGREYTVTGDETAQGYKKGENFCTFVKEMRSLATATPEYLAFPEAEGGYQ